MNSDCLVLSVIEVNVKKLESCWIRAHIRGQGRYGPIDILSQKGSKCMLRLPEPIRVHFGPLWEKSVTWPLI